MEKRHYVSISVSNAFLAVDFVILNRMTSSVVCHILVERMFTSIENKLRRIMEKRHYVSISVSNAFLAVDFVILNRMTSSVVCHILCIPLRNINLVVQKLSHCM